MNPTLFTASPDRAEEVTHADRAKDFPNMGIEKTHQSVVEIAAFSKQAANSGSNLTASIGRNTVFGITASIVQVATRLVVVPTVIAHLGLDGFGIWSIIVVTAGAYMRFGAIGSRSAYQKYVAEAQGMAITRLSTNC